MPITLAEMKVGLSDKVAQHVVDTFLRHSEILQLLPFDNCVSPQGGSTLTYAYVQKKLPSVAAFRALNTEYTPGAATLEKKTADLKIFGGSFELDRVLKQAEGRYNNMAFQMQEKILAAISLFHYTLINGDATTYANEFDGLDKMLVGTSTEFGMDEEIDVSNAEAMKANADKFYEALQILIAETGADALLCNARTITKIQTLARILGYKTETEEAFGRKVTTMDGVRLMDLGDHYTVAGSTATANSCVQVYNGLTDIYGVKFDVNDGFHAATLTGNGAIHQYLPDFNAPGAVKKGEVEMVAACVLKNTRHAGVLRNVRIAQQPQS